MTGEPPGLFGTCSKEPSIRDATCNEDRFVFVQRRTAHHTCRFAYSRDGAPSHLRNISLPPSFSLGMCVDALSHRNIHARGRG